MKLYTLIASVFYRERIKRFADMLEKLGIGALLWGVFKSADWGLTIGFCSILVSLVLTRKEQK